MLKVGNTVKLHEDAIFVDNRVPNKSLFGLTLYVRAVKENDVYTIARNTTGAVLGDIKEEFLINLSENEIAIDPYIVLAFNSINIYANADVDSGVIQKSTPFSIYNIIDEKNNMGKIQVGKGWICLDDVQKLSDVVQ